MDIFNPGTWFSSWASSMGGWIASGIESGFLSLVKDLWDVILGPLEIILGVIIILTTLVFSFHNQLFALASLAGTAALAA